jgi:hypothetical protein
VVVVERAVTDVPRPTLFDIVIVWDEVTVGRLVKISSSSVLPSLQPATEKVNLKSFASMRDRELQEAKALLKRAESEHPVTVRAGIDCREVQLLKAPAISVIAEVLNDGMLIKEGHPLNILFQFVTAAVLNKGTVIMLRQPLNMLLIVVTAAVLNMGMVTIPKQLPNMLLIFVTATVLNKGTFVRARHS